MTEKGYEIGRDSRGFTTQERNAMHSLVEGMSIAETARALGVSRQRAFQIVGKLKEKGVDVDALMKGGQ